MRWRYPPSASSESSLGSLDGLERISSEELSLVQNQGTSSTRISRWLGTILRWFDTILRWFGTISRRFDTDVERPSARRRNIAGFMDLPGEIRNMIYRLIYDHIDPLVHLEWPTDKILVKTSAYYDPKILAIIDVTPQIRQEFLSLLIFGNTEVPPEDLARYGPRSLSSPDYVTGGTICIMVKLHVSHCGASEDDCGGYRSEYMKARGKACKYHREIEVELTARYDGDGRGTASFRFGYGAGIDLSCNTRRLITSVLANVFVTNENVGIEGLFVATHRLASLELVAVYCRSEEVNQPFDGAYFKISRAIGEARPEIWVTAQRKDLRSG